MSEEENYIIENETQDTKKKQEYWNTGIGLNKVDNLEPSKYLIDLSKKNINGELKYSEVENLLKTYYENIRKIHSVEPIILFDYLLWLCSVFT